MIKCLIFDCDGTLVDSEYLCNLGLEIMLKDYGVQASAHEMVEKFRGGKLANILSSLEDEHSISFNGDFEPKYRNLVEDLFEKELTLCMGVQEFLSVNTLELCVASSGPVKKIRKSLEVTGISNYFGNNIFSSYIINSWKPAPDLFLHAAAEMGYKANECLVIEDSMKGIEAGLAAGMNTILFDPLNLFKEEQRVQRIDNMIQLNDFISSKNEA